MKRLARSDRKRFSNWLLIARGLQLLTPALIRRRYGFGDDFHFGAFRSNRTSASVVPYLTPSAVCTLANCWFMTRRNRLSQLSFAGGLAYVARSLRDFFFEATRPLRR